MSPGAESDPAAPRVRLSVARARAALCDAAPALDAVERVAVAEALGRVAAEAVAARASVPHFHASAMDGIAVRARDVAGAREELPVELRCDGAAGAPRFVWVDTGNPLPEWADAVIMVEALDTAGAGDRGQAGAPRRARAGDAAVRVRAPAAPWQHVRVVGEDVVAGERIAAPGQRLGAHDVGLLLAAGVTEIAVRARPRVAIVPTGDELIEPDALRLPGRIVESNSRMVAALARDWGAEPLRLPPVGDDRALLAARLRDAAARADVLCVIAGSSAGSRDFTADALGSLGTVLVHGLDLVPGRPTILAALRATGAAEGASSRPAARVAIGLPGYPVAAAMVCRELLRPLLRHLAGEPPAEPAAVRAFAAQALTGRPGAEELVRVDVGPISGRLVARPLARGAGALAALARAGGLVRLGAPGAAVAAGDEIEVELLQAEALLRATLLASGVADPVLAALEDAAFGAGSRLRIALRSRPRAAALRDLRDGAACAAVVAVPAGAARPAGARVHALEGAGIGAVVLRLAARDAGLVVAAGNPLGVRDAADARERGLRLVPALRRAGVRAVAPPIDVAAGSVGEGGAAGASERGGVAGSAEAGPLDEELPPIAVAAAVASGLADVGAGSAWSAAALGLAFVPIARVELLLVLRADVDARLREALASALASDAFRRAVAALPGYEAVGSGEEAARR